MTGHQAVTPWRSGPAVGSAKRAFSGLAPADPVRKLSSVRPSQRSMNSACWQPVRADVAMPVSVDGLIG